MTIRGGFFGFITIICCAWNIASATESQQIYIVEKLANKIKTLNFLDGKISKVFGDLKNVTDDEIVCAYQLLIPGIKLNRDLKVSNDDTEKQKINLLARMIDKEVIQSKFLWNDVEDLNFNNILQQSEKNIGQAISVAVCYLIGDKNPQNANKEIERAVTECSGHSVHGQFGRQRHVMQLTSQFQLENSVFCVLSNEAENNDVMLIMSLIKQLLSPASDDNWISDTKIEIEQYEQSPKYPVIYAILKHTSMNDVLGKSLFFDKSVGFFTMIFKPKEISTQSYITDAIKIPLAVEQCNGIKRLSMKTCYPAQVKSEFRCVQKIQQQQMQLLPFLFKARLHQNHGIQQLVTITSNYKLDELLNQIVHNVAQLASNFIVQFNNINSEIDRLTQSYQIVCQKPIVQVQVQKKYSDETMLIQDFKSLQTQQINFQLEEQKLCQWQQNLDQIRCQQQQLATDAMDYVVGNFMDIPQLMGNTYIKWYMENKGQFFQLGQRIESLNVEINKLLSKTQQMQQVTKKQLNGLNQKLNIIEKIKSLYQQIKKFNEVGFEKKQQWQSVGEQTKMLAEQVIGDYDKVIQQAKNLKPHLTNVQQINKEEFTTIHNGALTCDQNQKEIHCKMEQIQNAGVQLEDLEKCFIAQDKQLQCEIVIVDKPEIIRYSKQLDKLLGELNTLMNTINQKREAFSKIWGEIASLFQQLQKRK